MNPRESWRENHRRESSPREVFHINPILVVRWATTKKNYWKLLCSFACKLHTAIVYVRNVRVCAILVAKCCYKKGLRSRDIPDVMNPPRCFSQSDALTNHQSWDYAFTRLLLVWVGKWHILFYTCICCKYKRCEMINLVLIMLCIAFSNIWHDEHHSYFQWQLKKC